MEDRVEEECIRWEEVTAYEGPRRERRRKKKDGGNMEKDRSLIYRWV